MSLEHKVMEFMLGFKKCHFMFENDILRNYSQKSLGVIRGDFWGFGCPTDAQTPTWLRLWQDSHNPNIFPIILEASAHPWGIIPFVLGHRDTHVDTHVLAFEWCSD